MQRMSRRQIRLPREIVAFSSDAAAGIAGLPDRRLRRPRRRHRPARREDVPAEGAVRFHGRGQVRSATPSADTPCGYVVSHEPSNAPQAPAMRHRGPASLSAGPLPAPDLIVEPRSAARKGTLMQSANPRRWAALALIALAQFMVIMDTSIIGVALPEIQRRPRLQRRATSRGSSTPTSSPSAACCCSAAASPTCSAPAGSSPPAGSILAAALAGRRARRDHRRRDRRPCRAGRRRGADRTVGADAADDALRLRPEGAHEGLRRLRRRRPRRRHRRRVPRRRDHRVDLAGRGSSTSTSRSRSSCSPLIPVLLPAAAGAPRLDRHRGALTATAGLGADGVRRSSARPRRAGARLATLGAIAGGIALLAVFVAIQAARREPLMRLGILRAPNLAAANLAQAAARRGVDPDVVLPEPLPAAGARLRRLRGRRGAAADDRRDHAADGRRRARG